MKNSLQVLYQYRPSPDAEARLASAFEMVFDELEKALEESESRGKETYGKQLSDT